MSPCALLKLPASVCANFLVPTDRQDSVAELIEGDPSNLVDSEITMATNRRFSKLEDLTLV
jgi:hypothetical protein